MAGGVFHPLLEEMEAYLRAIAENIKNTQQLKKLKGMDGRSNTTRGHQEINRLLRLLRESDMEAQGPDNMLISQVL